SVARRPNVGRSVGSSSGSAIGRFGPRRSVTSERTSVLVAAVRARLLLLEDVAGRFFAWLFGFLFFFLPAARLTWSAALSPSRNRMPATAASPSTLSPRVLTR